MEEIVRDSITRILETLSSFDTHELIIKMAHENQREYIRLLAEQDGETPFQSLHSKIGKQIQRLIHEFSLSESESRSRDIFGHESRCSRWARS